MRPAFSFDEQSAGFTSTISISLTTISRNTRQLQCPSTRYARYGMAGRAATPEIHPMAFINGAGRFAWAAEELQKLLVEPGRDPHADPVYLLVAHAIELA